MAAKQVTVLLDYDIANQAMNYHHTFISSTNQMRIRPPDGPILHNLAKTFDGPPTLERSGSEHRAGRFPSSSLRGEDLDERWSLL